MGSPEVLTIKDVLIFVNCRQFQFSSSTNRSNIADDCTGFGKNWRIVVGNLWPLPFQFWQCDKFLFPAESVNVCQKNSFPCSLWSRWYCLCTFAGYATCFLLLFISLDPGSLKKWQICPSVTLSEIIFLFFVVDNNLLTLRQNDFVYSHRFANTRHSLHSTCFFPLSLLFSLFLLAPFKPLLFLPFFVFLKVRNTGTIFWFRLSFFRGRHTTLRQTTFLTNQISQVIWPDTMQKNKISHIQNQVRGNEGMGEGWGSSSLLYPIIKLSLRYLVLFSIVLPSFRLYWRIKFSYTFFLCFCLS